MYADLATGTGLDAVSERDLNHHQRGLVCISPSHPRQIALRLRVGRKAPFYCLSHHSQTIYSTEGIQPQTAAFAYSPGDET
jgi:hypothetical protein